MGTLFIDRSNCELTLSGQVLSLRVPEQPVRRVPAALVSRVILRSDTRLTSSVLTGLAAHGVGVTMLGGRGGSRVASVLGAPHSDVHLRITQVRRLDDREFCSAWARQLVRAKLRSQRRLLQQALDQRADLRKPLFDALKTLDGCLASLASATDVDSMRGLEGAGAAAYFRGYTRLFAPSLNFSARRRRPPPDPVNAALSLGYTLLQSMAVQACHVQGLDPMIGYLHLPTYARASMACDLVEPWRTRVDALVWEMFRSGDLTADHFGAEGNGAHLLKKTGRSHFYAAWAADSKALYRSLRRHARLASRSLGDLAVEFDTEADIGDDDD